MKDIEYLKKQIKKYPRVCYCHELMELLEDTNKKLEATNDSTAIDLLRDIRTWDILQEIERRKIKLALPADLRKRVGEILRRAGL